MARNDKGWVPQDSKIKDLMGRTFLYPFAIPPLDDVAVLMWGATLFLDLVSKPMQRLELALDNKEGVQLWKDINETAQANRKAKAAFFEERQDRRVRQRSYATEKVNEDLASVQQFGTQNMLMSKDSFVKLTEFTMTAAVFDGVDGAKRHQFGPEEDLREALSLKDEDLVGLIGAELHKEVLLDVRPQDLSVPAMREVLSIFNSSVNNKNAQINKDGTIVMTPIGAAGLGTIRAIIIEDQDLSYEWAKTVPLDRLDPRSKTWFNLAFGVAASKDLPQMREEAGKLITPNLSQSLPKGGFGLAD